MTREEAIKELTHELSDWERDCKSKHPMKDALRLAIEALNDIAKWRTWSHTYDNVCMNGTQGDLISREEAIYEIHDFFSELMDELPRTVDEDGDWIITDTKTANTLLVYNKMLCKRVDALPSADRPRGEWIYWREDGIKRCKCSRCLTSYGCLDTPYCPNCGADMRGETDES